MSAQDAQAPAPGGQAPPYAEHSTEQLQRLVAPIALYPDSLVAQILAASTFPEQVVEADIGSAVLGGVGIIGDATGITDTQSMTMTGTTPGAERFITGTPSTEVEVGAAGFTTVPELQPGLSTETGRRLEDMPIPAVRAASARVPSAATDKAERPGAFRHAEAPA